MAKIRERRRQERQRRLMRMLITGFGITVFLLTVTLIGVSANDREKIVSKQTGETLSAWPPLFKVEEIIIEEPDSMQIVMVGDMLMHEKIIKSGLQEDGTYNFDHLFVNVKDTIEGADLAIANQETIMGGKSLGYSGYPTFNTPSALADAEEAAGFDVLLFATNHTMDKGKSAVINCMDYLDENCPNLDYVGINRSQEAQNNIYVYEKNGIKVAILNYTYGLNSGSLSSSYPYLVNILSESKVIKDIKKAEEIADFTIVCPHWGTEYNMGTSTEQDKWTKIFVENGVDLVLGAHPHVIEPIEWITHENGNEMLVYYSLGNFVNGTSGSGSGVTKRMVGGIADVTIGRDGSGAVKIVNYRAIPIVCHVGEGSDYTVYYLEDYTEEMAKENLILRQDQGFSKEKCQTIVDSVWKEE